MNHRIKPLVLRWGLVLAVVFVAVPVPVQGDWRGRFDIGASPIFFDDDMLENRTPLTTRLRFQYQPETESSWLFQSNIRLRSEMNSKDGNAWRIRDLYLRYGQRPDQNPWTLTAGVFSPDTVAGTGDVMGAGIQYNFASSPTQRWGLGIFGGANAVIRKGGSDTDGLRAGIYLLTTGSAWGRAGIGFVSVTDTDFPADEMDTITFNTTVRLDNGFDFYQSGEYTLSSAYHPENTLTYYYANAGYDLNDTVRVSVTYDLYDRLPYLAPLPDEADLDDPPDSYDRYEVYRGQSIGPRIDVRIGSNWRAYTRYRYRETDNFESNTVHQVLAGFGCTNLGGTGLGLNGSVFVNRGDTKDWETGFLTLSRDIGSSFNLSVTLATDRFAYPETVASAPHIESTWRAGLSGFYRIQRNMTAFIDIERTFGDSEKHRETRVLFNWQYRF